jgi:hypothetical protein
MYRIMLEAKTALSIPTYKNTLNDSNHTKLFKKTTTYRIVCVRTSFIRFTALSLTLPAKL